MSVLGLELRLTPRGGILIFILILILVLINIIIPILIPDTLKVVILYYSGPLYS